MECAMTRLQQLPTDAAPLILWTHVQSIDDDYIVLPPRRDYPGNDSSAPRDGEVNLRILQLLCKELRHVPLGRDGF
jgi:hypothetical protein